MVLNTFNEPVEKAISEAQQMMKALRLYIFLEPEHSNATIILYILHYIQNTCSKAVWKLVVRVIDNYSKQVLRNSVRRKRFINQLITRMFGYIRTTNYYYHSFSIWNCSKCLFHKTPTDFLLFFGELVYGWIFSKEWIW